MPRVSDPKSPKSSYSSSDKENATPDAVKDTFARGSEPKANAVVVVHLPPEPKKTPRSLDQMIASLLAGAKIAKETKNLPKDISKQLKVFVKNPRTDTCQELIGKCTEVNGVLTQHVLSILTEISQHLERQNEWLLATFRASDMIIGLYATRLPNPAELAKIEKLMGSEGHHLVMLLRTGASELDLKREALRLYDEGPREVHRIFADRVISYVDNPDRRPVIARDEKAADPVDVQKAVAEFIAHARRGKVELGGFRALSYKNRKRFLEQLAEEVPDVADQISQSLVVSEAYERIANDQSPEAGVLRAQREQGFPLDTRRLIAMKMIFNKRAGAVKDVAQAILECSVPKYHRDRAAAWEQGVDYALGAVDARLLGPLRALWKTNKDPQAMADWFKTNEIQATGADVSLITSLRESVHLG